MDLQDLAQTLVDALDVRAALIMLWHTEEGQVLAPAGAGLDRDSLGVLGAALATAAPDLLQTLAGARPQAARLGVLPGWQVEPSRKQAEVLTRWGLMQVRAVPVDGAVVLLAVVISPGAPGWEMRPYAWRVVVRHLELALQTGSLRARLDDERRLLDTVLMQTNDGLFILDDEGRVVRCNPAAERMTGWRESELLGQPFAEALHARPMHWAGEADSAAELPMTLEETGRDRLLELVLVNRAGQPFYTEACVTPVAGPGGLPARLVVSLRDVSAGREAEELQATFLAVISHELQTPLAIIRGYAELLADSVDRMPPARMKPKLDAIADESDRLSKMVASLLDASRIGAGGLDLTREPVDMESLVRRAVQRVESLSPDHQFVVAMPDDLPAVLADYARIEQVVRNLLENAVKYSPKGTRITVSGEALSDAVVIRVSDEGVGVPAAERERIFHRFARLDSRVVRQMKGVGLGLYIARAIVQAHGGRIWVDAAPGGGAQFSFSLPRQYNAPLPVLFGRN